MRRDNCLLVKDIVNKCLDLIIRQNDKEAALNYCKEMISDLFLGRIDISLLIITKGIGKRTESKSDKPGAPKGYKAKQAHVELANRLKERDQGTIIFTTILGAAPGVGDRVAYVFVHSDKGTRGYEKSEDPITVLEKDIPIDIQYYIDHQLRKPLKRIFKHVIPNATNEIFSMIPRVASSRRRTYEVQIFGEDRQGGDGRVLHHEAHLSGLQDDDRHWGSLQELRAQEALPVR